MKIAITGADRAVGALLCRRLGAEHTVRPIGVADEPGLDLGEATADYRRADLRLPPAARLALAGTDLILHAQPHDPGPSTGADSDVLDVVARGTYVLMNTAHDLGIGRMILLSHLSMMEDYPEDFAVSEHWLPHPRAEAASLAPYLAELVGREISRIGKIECICLRPGVLGAAEGTSEDDLLAAVQKAMHREMSSRGYNWFVEHIASGGRFATVPGR